MGGDETGLGPERLVETADCIPMTPLGCDGDAEIVGHRRVLRGDRQGGAIGTLSFRQPARLKVGHGVRGKLYKFVRYLFGQRIAPAANPINVLYIIWKKF